VPVKRGRKTKAALAAEMEANISLASSSDTKLAVSGQSNLIPEFNSSHIGDDNRGQKRPQEVVPLLQYPEPFILKKFKTAEWSVPPHNTSLESQNSELEYRNSELEQRLIQLTEEKERMLRDLSTLQVDMVKKQQRMEQNETELQTANEHLFKMSKIFNVKNAEISGLRLSEERLALDNNKLYRQIKATQDSAEFQGQKFQVTVAINFFCHFHYQKGKIRSWLNLTNFSTLLFLSVKKCHFPERN